MSDAYLPGDTRQRIQDLIKSRKIRIDTTVKKQAIELFASLGLDMSGAINIFLHQCVLRGGLPFTVELPQYNQATLDAMAEARRISRDPDIKGSSGITAETLESLAESSAPFAGTAAGSG